MEIPFFGLAREYEEIGPELIKLVPDILQSGEVLQSSLVSDFEEVIASISCRKHAIAVGSCTDALFFSLRALGVGAGDEVLVTDFSFIASCSSILRSGAVPVFVDIGKNYNLDLKDAEEKITRNTRAMVGVHLFGQMNDVDKLEAFCEQFGIFLIEDSAQAFGASFAGRKAGSMGDVSCFSFDPTKVIAAPGSGGIVTTDDEQVANSVRALRYHGKVGAHHEHLGYNSQMSSITAAMLMVKVNHELAWRRGRQNVARSYLENLENCERLPFEDENSEHIYHKFVLEVDAIKRDEIKNGLESSGIQVRIHYDRPMQRHPMVANLPSHCPATEEICKRVLSLPIHPFLKEDEVSYIIEKFNQLVS